MRWYEYKMETDDLYAPDDLKAKLLAMTDQLTEEEKAQPMMKTAAPVPAQSAPVQPKKKLIRFPAKRVGALAACLAVCVVGYGAFATGQIGLGAKSSSPAVYYSADSTAAAMAAGGADRAAVDSPMAADYSLNTMALESGADNGTAVYSEDDAAAAAHSTDHAKIIYTANLSLESKDYDAARAALDAALAEAGGYLESSSEYSDAGDSRSVSLTYRVPQQNYENFLAAVAEAGNVTYKNQQADDVTAQYMDVETRLENLKNQRTRLQQLQQQADNLSDLLEIESSLTDVQSQIESWQSQMDWYNDQVEECTVYVSLSEVSTYSPPSEGFGSRFVSALSAGWQNFVGGLQQVIVALAGAWPVVVIAAAACAGFVVTAIESTLAAFLFETPTLADFAANAWPIVFCGVFSSGVAYTLQILGQKDLNPAIASLIMCLESVFSALGGWLLLHQSLSMREVFGCTLIFAAVVLAQLPVEDWLKCRSASRK